MDNQSHFKWELTRDELDTIWWALTERETSMRKKAERVHNGEKLGCTEAEYHSMANKCLDLYGQINRMRNRYW